MHSLRFKLSIAFSIVISLLIITTFYFYSNNVNAQGTLPICAVSGQITQNTNLTMSHWTKESQCGKNERMNLRPNNKTKSSVGA